MPPRLCQLPTAVLASALFRESGDALIVFDPASGEVLDANTEAERLSGLGREELLAAPAADLFRSENAGSAQRLHAALTGADETLAGLEGVHFQTRSGEHGTPVRLSVKPLPGTTPPLSLATARDRRDQFGLLEKLRHGQEQLARVLETVADGIVFVDRSHRVRLFNEAAARILGRTRDDLLGQLWRDVVADWTHPDGSPIPADDRFDARVLEGGETVRGVERTHIGPTGRTVVRSNGVPLSDARGEFAGMVISFSDVTDEERALEALRRNEERFRALVENSSDFTLLKDPSGAILFGTPSLERVTGYRSEDVIGQSAIDLLHPEDRETGRAWQAACAADPTRDYSSTLRYLHASGEYRYVECQMRNRLADPAVAALVCNARDITDRVRATQALASEHALLRGLIDSLPDPIYLKDPQGAYRRCNAAFEALAGRAERELVGGSDSELFGEQRATATATAEQPVLVRGAPQIGEEWTAYPDGRRVLFETLRAPLRDSSGTITGLIGMCRDVTQQRQLEEQLRQAGKLEAIGQLAGGVAHDFNNLLTAILGNLALVQESLPQADPNRELVAASEQAAWRAAELTKQLLGFARRAPIRPEALNLNTAVAEAIAMLRRAIDPRIAIDVQAAPDVDLALADPGQINQILINLCLNARDAMPRGGRLTLTIANAALTSEDLRGRPGARPGAFVRLTVTDTGAGIPADVRERIFEPFFTTKGPGQGTGLGLAMVHGIVQQHLGWIDCTSEVGSGTRFDIFLPRADEAATVADRAGRQAAPRGRETVLLADDEPLLRNLGRAILERHGYRVVLAADGQDAVDQFRRDPAAIDLAILDLSMPKLSGREACRLIWATRPGARVLLASGYAADTGSMLGEPGVRGFIAKPYAPADLAASVRAALDL